MESANMAGRNVQTYTLENKNTLRKLATLRNEGQLCDLMFIFPDGSQIEAHKAIVCQYSSVIKARCVDIDQHKLQVLCTDIDNEQAINPSILNIMLDYIYGLSITIRQEYIQDIMRLAIKLNIPEFLGDCDKILFENKALGPSDLMINAQNIKQEQTGSGYETGQVSDFGMADQPHVTPSTSFDDTNLQEPIDEKAAKPPGRRKRKATKVVKASVEQLPEPQSDEDNMMDNPLDDDTDEYEADNFTAIKAEEADSDYNESASPKKRKRSKAKKTTVSTKRSHQKKTATLDPLFCKECDQKFDAYKDAAEHHKGVHNLIVCDVCAKIFDNEADLRRHSVLHSEQILIVDAKGRLVYHCQHCSEEIQHRQSFLKHMKTHDEGKMFKCKICSVTKIQLMQFVTHVFRHQDESKHSSMDKISNLMCDICGKIFKGSNYLKLHKSSIHGDKTFNCPSCNRTYGAKKALHRHMKCHGERSNECSTCGMKFVLKENLKYHIASIHSGSKSHKCKACDVGFVYRSQLYTHYRANEECANIADVNVTFFQCEICNKSFTTKKSWTHHKIRTHNVDTSNESRFACKQCSKSYVIQSDLNKHVQRSHVRPHLCSVCGKSFGDKKHLEEHFRRHTGEKPFSCDTCGKRFTQFGSLYKHKHIHLKEFPNPNKIDSDTLNDPIGPQTYQHDDLYTPVNAYVPFE